MMVKKEVSRMKYITCPKCKTKIADGHPKCPECGYDFGTRKNRIPLFAGSCLLIVAFASGLAVNISVAAPQPTPTPNVEIIETIAPTPVPTPTVENIEVYAFGRELDADGFTAYVGDKPFTLTAYPQPEIARAEVSWSIKDSHDTSESAALVISPDGMTCEFTALKPSGKNELTVRCYGAELVIPVYLWER